MTTVAEALAWNTKIQNILNEFRAKQAALRAASLSSEAPDNPEAWNEPPPRDSLIRSLSQDTVDISADTLQTSRSIGDLTGGKTRLNLFSALSKNDRVDFYNFNVTTSGKTGISITSDVGVHVQLLKANGTVIADSEAKFGAAADNFQDWIATQLYLERGGYYLKVTRASGDVMTDKPNYAIQLAMGSYFTEDYQTVETPAVSGVAAGLSPIGAQNAASVSTVLNQLAGGNLFDFLI